MISIDNAMKAKLTNYNLVKGSLTQMQRKKTSGFVTAFQEAPFADTIYTQR